ncbi:50S ribosomal protein L3 [Acidiferrobacter thiooxydans]|jgi:large subunit ribosomal protein L3|uniref:Large ribosomal subunit protein uL3 n=1 Tax=Acidiferrobacter thiooxydans TaxID=163359 RepID=A0A1C2FXX4_9GAMM|nr:50S ribosomal protein L3 [Acidiferrobacter thiooxydans]MDA8192027.1 50S ribosomal protein L3 [Gammaproteobacteria bacterium]RCN58708.1 50S ribosomal protein L3 [Acidiferrobacter thiooxydans]UEO00335.1 50S ribosomal protein L3 [Acidiferrobacter thiooxydans]
MALGIVGKKIGMSRVFAADGTVAPVTVVAVERNHVAQIKDVATDGYRAVQIAAGTRRPSRVTKAQAGHFAKAKIEPAASLWEFRLGADEGQGLEVGAEVRVDIFAEGQKVDVQGTTIGKGFAGVIKRHHFGGGRASHGNSLSHRAPGSIGQRQTPGRVFPGKKMAGHLGAKTRTQQNLVVVRVDAERNMLLIRGAVPGSAGSDVVVRPAVKAGKAEAKQS